MAANYKREFDENMANIAECTRLETKLAGIGKDHADDWKRIQDAEREVERLKECLAHESNLVIIAMRTLDELRAELAEWKSDCTHVHKADDETIARLKAEVLSISNERNLAFEAFNVEKARHAAEVKWLIEGLEVTLKYLPNDTCRSLVRETLAKFKGEQHEPQS